MAPMKLFSSCVNFQAFLGRLLIFGIVYKKKKSLITSVFRKVTFSGVFTNFKSFMPVAYKFGLVYILLHCSFSICSSYEKFHEECYYLCYYFL